MAQILHYCFVNFIPTRVYYNLPNLGKHTEVMGSFVTAKVHQLAYRQNYDNNTYHMIFNYKLQHLAVK